MISNLFDAILVRPIFNLLALIYAVVPGHDFGVAVIILTILIRLAIWPLVARQLHSQKALQDLSPEVAKVRKQAKGDKQLESKLLMELYKEKEINPFASLLPLLIQLPLFIALYVALRDVLKSGEVARQLYGGLKSLGPLAAVVAHPASLKPVLFGHLSLAKPSWLLALLAGGAQYFQTAQLMPKNPNADPQAKALASSSKLFPIITFLIGLRLPGALSLYWTVASLVAIIQQHILLNRDVEELEGEEVGVTGDVVALAKARLEELLTYFGVNTKVKVEEADDRILLQVQAPDSAKLIGHRGENLRAIQHLLNMMLRGSGPVPTFIDVDIDGYKQARGQQVMAKATAAAERVLASGRPATLEPMNPAERRLVHMAAAETAGIVTESIGEGSHRRVVIKRDS